MTWMKTIVNFREWLIYKLGGVTTDFVDKARVSGTIKDYWVMHNAREGLYIDPKNYKKEYKESIEKELASKVGLALLRNGCMSFNIMSPRRGQEEMYISAHVNALKLKDPQPYHLRTYLTFEEDNNEQTDNISNS